METTKENLITCMATLLQSVDNSYIQAYSISMVPGELKKSPNDVAYIPRVVSMGPRYKRSREELIPMEEKKLRCMLSLFHRTREGQAVESLRKCCEKVCDLNEKIRASYVDDIHLKDEELAKIMLVDGCFLLELLITKGFESQLPCLLKDPSPAPEVLQNDDVLSDLTLFENQIPIFIVHELSETLFPHFFGEDSNRETIFNNLALSILGYSHFPEVEGLKVEPPHLLDVVHSLVTTTTTNTNNNDHDVVDINIHGTGYRAFKKINIHGTQTQHVNVMMELKLKRCATRLQAAGVSIQLAKDKKVSDLDFEFKFEGKKLEIAPLNITKTTKAKWRNVIAWEHHKEDWKKAPVENAISTNYGKFTSAALIFNDLICCPDDVKLLKDKNIIVNHTKMSDKELEEFFRTMSFGVDHGVVGSCYVKMVDELNKYYSTTSSLIQIWKTLCHLLKYHYEWLKKFMQRDYNFVATVVSLCTVVSTVYTMVAYHHPPK